MKEILIVLMIVTRTFGMCDKENSVELTNRTYNGITYEEGEYFVDNITGIERGCVCDKERCIRKCCALHQAYDEDERLCVDFDEGFRPQVYDMRSYLIPGFNVTKEFHLLFNNMTCFGSKVTVTLRHFVQDYHLKMDGQLYVIKEDHIPSDLVYGPHEYCVDNFISEASQNKNKSIAFNGFLCFRTEPEEDHYALSVCCMIISCLVTIPVVAVYAFLPELRTLHGMVMTAYLMCFFAASFFIGIMDIFLLLKKINQTQCIGLTFVIYFSLLTSFFWLNVMCYDLWSKLRITNMAHGFIKTKQVRFLMYSAYAFGVPAAMTILLAALEFSNLPVNITLLPHLRRQPCLIGGKSKLLYLHVPIILLFVINLVLFILTAKRILETKKQTQILNQKDTQRVSLYVKLFIVTGIDWMFEVINSIWPNIPYLDELTDVDDILIVIIFFILFLCKKRIFMAIKIRYKTLTGQEQSSPVTNTTTTSSLNQSQSIEDIQLESK